MFTCHSVVVARRRGSGDGNSPLVWLACLAAAILLLSVQPVRAAAVYWGVPIGNWSDAANWGGALPTANDAANIVNGGTATITQPGSVCNYLYLGSSAGSGTVQMTGGGLSASFLSVGDSGTGAFTQSGGTNTPNELALGDSSTGSGTYTLSGTGQLTTTYHQYVGLAGTGTFVQSGGANKISSSYAYLTLGDSTGSNGTYLLSGTGQLSAPYEYVGHFGVGSIAQSGGANTVAGNLYLGSSPGGSGTYTLGGSGQLSAPNEYVGSLGTGEFAQSGGTNTTNYLSIGVNSRYRFSGGTLQVNGQGLACQGVFDGSGSTGLLSGAGGIVDLSQATLQNVGAMSVSMGANSLLLLPAGFNPSTAFGSFSSAGLTHVGGTTLDVPAGKSVGGWGAINDPVDCRGTIAAAAGGSIELSGGLTVSDSGSVSLGSGSLIVNNTTSAMSGGSLSAANHYIGKGGTGSFAHSAGTSTIASGVYLGYNAADKGTYTLSGAGQLSAQNQYVGYSGTGTFTQSGGTNTVSAGIGTLYLGYNPGSSGTYSLSGNGQLSAPTEFVGCSGSGTFVQSGGLNMPAVLKVGYNAGSSGSYSLSGTGHLSATKQFVGGAGAASFQQTGGTNTAGYLTIGSGGRYQLSGGTLQVDSGLANQGVFDGGNGAAALIANCLVDLTSGTWKNLGSTSVTMGSNSLLIVPPGFSPSKDFANYTSSGLTHTAGTTLDVPAGNGFGGWGSINDPVTCQGWITAAADGSINLNGGLVLAGSGAVNLGTIGTLTVNNTTSGMSGGSLSVYNHYLGKVGTGSFAQSGGTNTIATSLYLGYNTADNGTYALSGTGILSASSQYVGYSGIGVFSQSAGANSASSLQLGYQSGSNGTYNLSGTSQLSVLLEYVACANDATAKFQQSGGTNATDYLSIGSGGQYVLSGGTLQIKGGMSNQGVFDGANGSAALSANGLVDLTIGTWKNLASTSVSLGAKSLLIVPAGFDPATFFGSYTNLGLIHTAGTPLVVPAGKSIGGTGPINDPVVCQGTLTGDAIGQTMSLNNGLVLSGSGYASLSSLTVNDTTSAVSGGSLYASTQFVGNGGTGLFTNSAGGNSASQLYLGYKAGNAGTYLLSGSGTLSSRNQYVGYSGDGTFVQSGGTNSSSNYPSGPFSTLYLGYNATGNGTYVLSAGKLSMNVQYVGYVGTGTFVQSGGTNTMGNAPDPGLGLVLGVSATGTGSYILSASGQLSAGREQVGYGGTGTFTQSGGTNTVSSLLLGVSSGGTGSYVLSASGQLSAGIESVGYAGTGTFTQSGGTSSAYVLQLASLAQSSGTYNLTGGILALQSLNQGSGTAAFNFGGGTLQAGANFTTSVPMMLTATGGNANVDTNAFALTLSGALAGRGGLKKVGEGTLCLSGANSYAGLSTIAVGTLELAPAAQGPVLTGGGADIQGGALVLDYAAGATPAAAVLTLLKNSYGTGFAGGQIHSSTAAADASHALGWTDDGLSHVTIAFTLFGDANLDGGVGIADLNKVLTSFDKTGMNWGAGDFNYDDKVDISDLNKVLTNYNASVGVSARTKAVPEPSAIAILLAGTAFLFAWRTISICLAYRGCGRKSAGMPQA